MHIVFIVGSYYPNYSAVGKCVGNIADELSKLHKVTVICSKSFFEQENEEIYNNQRIIRILTNERKQRFKIQNKIKYSNNILRNIYKFILNIHKFYMVSQFVLSKESIRNDLVQKYLQQLINIEEDIDIIIPACMPFESIIASSEFKRKYKGSIHIIPYVFDQFTESDTLHRFKLNKILKKKRHIKLENRVYSDCSSILAMHSLKTHLSKNIYYIDKINYVEHPLIVESKLQVQNNNNKIKVSYIGGLYKNYVEPNYLLDMFKLINNKNITLNFYIIGNCMGIVNEYSKYSKGRIINNGSVDKKNASIEILKSNILISIAEKSGIQMSSKIFEYMSCGKPIIHFYTVDNDVNLNILQKYPFALCLKQDIDLLEVNAKKFEKFCKTNYNKQISFNDVEKIFIDATPTYTANLIENIVNINTLYDRSDHNENSKCRY